MNKSEPKWTQMNQIEPEWTQVNQSEPKTQLKQMEQKLNKVN